jgi:hypothetical protein
MEQKPDMIRALVFLFAAGLVITGVTSLEASDDRRVAPASDSQQAVTIRGREGQRG